MSKFLLLLCFTAVHVLGEGQENVSPGTSAALFNNVTSSNGSQQHFEASSSSSKVPVAAPVKVPLGASDNITSSEVAATNHSSIQSAVVTPMHSTVMTPKTTTVSVDTSEPSTEKIPHVAIDSAVTHAPSDATRMASLTPGKWIINGTDKICVIVQMAVVFNVSYVNTNNTTSFNVFDIPVDNATTNVSGNCGKLDQDLTLKWSSKNVTNASMTVHFMKNETGNHYSLHHLDLVLPPANFPHADLDESMVLVNEEPNFTVGLSNSYRCLKQQTLPLTKNGTNQTAGYLTISGFQFQAFKADNSTLFGLAKDCAFYTPDVIPIAVGCALAGLVVIVLIAYLIGRRRNHSRGYVSM